jgi:phage baseplate assembly protein W
MRYTIVMGDTLQTIAQRQLGDASLWMKIAEDNNLSYPYIAKQSSPGVLSPGDTIVLTLEDNIVNDAPSLGSDLKLASDRFSLTNGRGGDLTVVAGDYELVHEEECLTQDTFHRLSTPVGTIPYHPSYGSELVELIGRKKDINWKKKAELEISRTAKCDPRVTEVLDITVDDMASGARIEYTAEATGILFRAREVFGDEEL